MDQPLASTEASDFLSHLPPEVVDSLTPEQRAAIWAASRSPTWKRHPINIRLTIPLFGHHAFLAVVGGTERRSPERLRREHRLHPLRTAGNALFVLGVAFTFYLAALLSLILLRSLSLV